MKKHKEKTQTHTKKSPFWLKKPFWLKVALLLHVHLFVLVLSSSFASTSDVHGTQRMASDRGAAGVIQRDPWASSTISAWPQEQSSRQPSDTRAGFCWSPPFSARSSSQEWSSSHSRGGHGARRCTTQLESAMQLLDAGDPALVPLQEALKKAKAQASAPPLRPGFDFQDARSQEEEKRVEEEAEQEILEAIKRRDVLKKKSRGRGRGGKTFWVESRTCQRRRPHCRSPPMLVVATRLPISPLGGARCSFAK